MHTLIFRATLLLLILVLLPLCMCVCLSRSRNPGDGLDGWSGTSTGFHPFSFYSRGSLGRPTSLGRFLFSIRTGRECSFPFFSFLPLVYLIIYCRSFNESLFKLYRSHSFLTGTSGCTTNPSGAAYLKSKVFHEQGARQRIYAFPQHNKLATKLLPSNRPCIRWSWILYADLAE